MEIERLIEQCRQWNREALGTLYKAYAQRMRGICQRYVCDLQAVDDVLHDAFIVIFTSFDKLRNEEKAEAWMAGIVRNVALKYSKRMMAVKTVPEDEVNEEALSTVAEPESTELRATLEELMQMVDRLPEGYGKVFRLSVFEGLSHKEIAEVLGIEPHSSSSQLARAKSTPTTPISEKSKHERPLTLQLLFNREISSHWSLTTGLSLTRMKSYFEINNENTSNTRAFINRTQRINYLGIPLKANFRILDTNHFNFYTSGGILLDIPVSARLTTRHVYSHSYNSQDITTGIHAPCQLSFGVGLGIQYEILPHINVFLEPSLNYYLPNRQGIETYRTEHPFDISIPAGVKISW
ncbi:MAG: sigma-70 family RNA polymerase sigma factor [Muribaculaceae bacterium]|nr:sigma-70 family RNA polymerase sigma factor [Muribaculaceae bacterium]